MPRTSGIVRVVTIWACIWSAPPCAVAADCRSLEPRAVMTRTKGLMVVAHPDDEFLFGGEALLWPEVDWHVVCMTHGPGAANAEVHRQHEFADSMAALRTSSYEMWDYYDSLDEEVAWDFERVRARVAALVTRGGFSIVATHGKEGEYGHPQHKACYAILEPLLTHVFAQDESAVWSSERARLFRVLYPSQHSVFDWAEPWAQAATVVPMQRSPAHCRADALTA